MNNPKKLWSTRTSAAQIPIKSQHFVSQNTIYQRTIWETYSSSKGAQLMLYWHDSLYFDTVDHTCTISVARDSAPVISNNLKTYHNSDFVTRIVMVSHGTHLEKNLESQYGAETTIASPMGGSRILFRRGCTRLLFYFNTNKPVSYTHLTLPTIYSV